MIYQNCSFHPCSQNPVLPFPAQNIFLVFIYPLKFKLNHIQTQTSPHPLQMRSFLPYMFFPSCLLYLTANLECYDRVYRNTSLSFSKQHIVRSSPFYRTSLWRYSSLVALEVDIWNMFKAFCLFIFAITNSAGMKSLEYMTLLLSLEYILGWISRSQFAKSKHNDYVILLHVAKFPLKGGVTFIILNNNIQEYPFFQNLSSRVYHPTLYVCQLDK